MEKKDSMEVDKRIELKKDRGDSLKRLNNKDRNFGKEIKDQMPDRGDSVLKTHKDKYSKYTKADDLIVKGVNKLTVNKNVVVDRHVNRLLSIEDKKRIRDKYTIKANRHVGNRKVDVKSNLKDSHVTDGYNNVSKKRNNETDNKEKMAEHTKTETTKIDKSDSKDKPHKRPVIKTIRAQNDVTKVYKSVTFTDHKLKQTTPLQIKIPTDTIMRCAKFSKSINQGSESKTSTKVKSIKNRCDKRKRLTNRDMSPDSLFKESGSPPTEVAKWSLDSTDKLTKPYYDAWFDTTLEAISKSKRKDKLTLENKSVIQKFKTFLKQRPVSPELVHENYLDERYTGKIKVNHR